MNTENTTENNDTPKGEPEGMAGMSKPATKTEQLTLRVMPLDKEYFNGLLEPFHKKHEGFTEIVKRLKTPVTVPVEVEVIKEVERKLHPGQFVMSFSEGLNEKLLLLRRLLLKKGKIPECTEAEFLEHFTLDSITALIEDKYSYLTRKK